ncbi:MAG: serine/threonine protein kinase [Acidobacteria bacterium]|nr:serine/threonine protein kinase [Acidobacteriota bacterium]
MTPERRKKLDALFHEALELQGEAREAHLARACGDDEQLREEVERMITSHASESSFIVSPISAETAGLTDDARNESLIGRRIGPYRVISQLGRGGMGEVFLAEDTRLERKIALKMLPAAFTQNPDRVRRFEREAKAASALNHPNILTIYEVGQIQTEIGGLHFIATEYVNGLTLRQQMESARLSIAETLSVAVQVASALSAAHEAGIVHRDIKPENLMLRPDGLVKVLDFGLAKLTERSVPPFDSQAPTAVMHSTEAGVLLGTPGYMSPEQARGQKVDALTDIFSLGVVLYELLTGRAPFAGSTSSDVIAAILLTEPVPLTHYLPEAPPELARIVDKVLRKDREERYQLVKDLLIDLKELNQELEIEARLLRSHQPAAGDETAVERVIEQERDGSTQVEPLQLYEANSARTGSSKIRRYLRIAAEVAVVLALTSIPIFFIRNNNTNEPGSQSNMSVAIPNKLISDEPEIALPREESYLEMFYDPQRGHLEFTFLFTIKHTGNRNYRISEIEGKLEPMPALANPLHFSSISSRLIHQTENQADNQADNQAAIPFTVVSGSKQDLTCSLVFPLTDQLLEELKQESARSLVVQFRGESSKIFSLKHCFYITNEFQQPRKQFRKRFRGTTCIKDHR